jgi:hypothetical protein
VTVPDLDARPWWGGGHRVCEAKQHASIYLARTYCGELLWISGFFTDPVLRPCEACLDTLRPDDAPL